MTVEPGWIPPGIDRTKANNARIYDWWLGGDHNFQADVDAARAAIALDRNIRTTARLNRAFLGRAVRFLAAEAGIRQFLDLGSGIPTQDNVHQVAQATTPGSRVAYADIDEVAVAHSRLILEDNPDATVIHADLRVPDKILAHPAVQGLLDFSQPIGLLLVAVLHFISDEEDPWQIVATLRDSLARGSYLVICHATNESRPAVAQAAETVYNRSVPIQAHTRSRADILRFFDGFELLDPGLVYIPLWRPDSPADVPSDPGKIWGLVGVGRKP